MDPPAYILLIDSLCEILKPLKLKKLYIRLVISADRENRATKRTRLFSQFKPKPIMSTQVMIKIIPVLLGSRYIERLERDSLSCTDHLFLFRSAMSSHLKYLYHFCFFYTEKSVVPVSLVIGVVCIYFLIFRNIRQTSVVSDKKYFKVRKACCLFPTEDKNRMRSLP